MTSLRPLRWWDLEAVATLEQELFDDAWSLETFWSELAGVPETRHYLAAVDEAGSLVGYAGLFATRHQADVQTLAVAPGSQSRGLGRALLEALLAEASRRGCGEVLLEVRVDNVAARALYERFGFEQISVRRGYYQPGGVDGLVLRKRL
jgi:ribosomal-protein-alanine N-acetyltransferase